MTDDNENAAEAIETRAGEWLQATLETVHPDFVMDLRDGVVLATLVENPGDPEDEWRVPRYAAAWPFAQVAHAAGVLSPLPEGVFSPWSPNDQFIANASKAQFLAEAAGALPGLEEHLTVMRDPELSPTEYNDIADLFAMQMFDEKRLSVTEVAANYKLGRAEDAQ